MTPTMTPDQTALCCQLLDAGVSRPEAVAVARDAGAKDVAMLRLLLGQGREGEDLAVEHIKNMRVTAAVLNLTDACDEFGRAIRAATVEITTIVRSINGRRRLRLMVDPNGENEDAA